MSFSGSNTLPASVLFIDNFDSFSFNIVDDIKQLGAKVTVVRNDVDFGSLETFIKQQLITHIIISPGPGAPSQAGICIDIIQRYTGQIPIFGICLGFQAIVEASGGVIGEIETPFHGKSSDIFYRKSRLLENLPNPFRAGRYHSLGATKVSDKLTVTAAVDSLPMAIESQELGLYGVQFHPESILTPAGNQILVNFLKQKSVVQGGPR